MEYLNKIFNRALPEDTMADAMVESQTNQAGTEFQAPPDINQMVDNLPLTYNSDFGNGGGASRTKEGIVISMRHFVAFLRTNCVLLHVY